MIAPNATRTTLVLMWVQSLVFLAMFPFAFVWTFATSFDSSLASGAIFVILIPAVLTSVCWFAACVAVARRRDPREDPLIAVNAAIVSGLLFAPFAALVVTG